jgi:hypothetical protein
MHVMPLRFTIRDLLWLTLVVALLVGSWLRLPMAYALTWLIGAVVATAIIFVLFSWPH